jgi:hypothetical protein
VRRGSAQELCITPNGDNAQELSVIKSTNTQGWGINPNRIIPKAWVLAKLVATPATPGKFAGSLNPRDQFLAYTVARKNCKKSAFRKSQILNLGRRLHSNRCCQCDVAIMLPNRRPMLPNRARMLPNWLAEWQHVEGALNTQSAFCVIYLSVSLNGKEMATWCPRPLVVAFESIPLLPMKMSEHHRHSRSTPLNIFTNDPTTLPESRCGYDSYPTMCFF